MLFLRSLIFQVVFILSSVLVPSLVILSAPLPLRMRLKVARSWGVINLLVLRYVCNLTYQVKGQEYIPNEPCVFMGKHQSTWETVAFTNLFPPFVWVLKKELLKVPVFGWCLSRLGTIAIDRSEGRKAINQITQAGKLILDDGLSIFVFPEGTRIAPREKGTYGIGGTILAKKTQAKIVPVAHNAGEFWGRGIFTIYPGIIQVHIGPPIDTTELKLATINQSVEDWIEAQMQVINRDFDQRHPEKYANSA